MTGAVYTRGPRQSIKCLDSGGSINYCLGMSQAETIQALDEGRYPAGVEAEVPTDQDLDLIENGQALESAEKLTIFLSKDLEEQWELLAAEES